MKLIKGIYKRLESHSSEYMMLEEVSRMEKRLQMLIALILFTPTILVALNSESLQQNKTTLIWGIIVAIYIAIYIYIEALNSKINNLKADIINWGIWVNLVAFVPFFISVGLYQNIISGLPLILFFLAMVTVFWSPLLFALILALEFILSQFIMSVRKIL